MAIRRWAATISIIAFIAGCWKRPNLSALNAHDTRLLLTRARTAKEQLTEYPQTQITAVLSGGELVDLTLTREAFTT